MKKINCLILDDEYLAVQLLENYAEKSGLLNVIYAGTDVQDALDFLNNQPIDLVFLDIQMPQLTGFELMALHKNHTFVLTTAYPNFALEAFKFHVIDYLLKPITFDVFCKSIEKFKHFNQYKIDVNENNEVITFKADRKIYRIEINAILHIEGLKDYVKVHTDSEKIMFLENMKDIIHKLPKGKFVRIHRSYILPIDKVKIIEGNRIIMKNGTDFIIGETYKQEIKRLFLLN